MKSPQAAVLASVAFLCGAGLLAWAFLQPPVGLCDPFLSRGTIAILAAQALGAAGLLAFRRTVDSGASAGVVLAAWAVATAAPLVVRTCAGRFDALRAMDVAIAALAAIALALLLAGMTARAESRGAGFAAVVVLLAAAAGLGASRICEARSQDRIWLTWARIDEAGAAVSAGVPPPGANVELGSVLEALPPEEREGLVAEDAWGRPLRYTSNGLTWTISSLGADGTRGPYQNGPSRDYVDDLVVTDGEPVAWPESPCAPGERPPPKPPVIDLRGR
jgi:hypothetical protein